MASRTSRTIIAALQVSLDGFVQGPDGEKDWADSWASALGLTLTWTCSCWAHTCIRTMATTGSAIEAHPERVAPSGRLPSESEIAYARLAARTPYRRVYDAHARLVATLAQIIPNVAPFRTLKAQPGKNVYVVGGATLVASLLNEDLIDELRLIVHPVVLGKGQALFAGIETRLSLDLLQAKPTRPAGSGVVSNVTADMLCRDDAFPARRDPRRPGARRLWSACIRTGRAQAQYLYLWTASEDATQPDFLAVLDVTEAGSRYGRLVTTLPVLGAATGRITPNMKCRRTAGCSPTVQVGSELRLRPDESRAAAHRRSIRRHRGLFASALVPATAEWQRAGHVPDAPRGGRHDGGRLGGADDGRHTRAFEIGELCRRRPKCYASTAARSCPPTTGS